MIMLYSSFLMSAGSVWVDCGGRTYKNDGDKTGSTLFYDGSSKASVLFFIEVEFLIFMLNILSIACFLASDYYMKWIDGIGLKFTS